MSLNKDQAASLNNGKVYQTWEVWSVDDQLYGRIVGDMYGDRFSLADFPRSWAFNGRKFCFWVVSHDTTMTREQALWFCKQVAEQKLAILCVDLEGMTTKWTSAPNL